MNNNIPSFFSTLNSELISEIMDSSTIQDIQKNTEILREGQYVKVIPIVIKGLIKVYTRHNEKELLLYYIKPNESCIMSFSTGLKNEPSKVFAITNEDTKVLLLPTNKVNLWTKMHPDFNKLFFQQYNLRYDDLINTINHVLFDKMDKRLYDYLKEKIAITKTNPIKISHREIASELGTAREVISRVMKKLEHEGKVEQNSHAIKIIG